MTHPVYLKDKARHMRIEKRLTLDEIAERLALPKTTVWYWIRDIPVVISRQAPNQKLGNEAMQRKYRLLREEAYATGLAEFEELCAEPTFRDFVCLYIAEGYKRSRNTVSIANSDPAVMRLSDPWIRSYSRNPVTYWVQYHADQDLSELCEFWGEQLGISPSAVRLQRRSNSAQLARRTWRSVHGVLTITANDTLFRSRLQAWIDEVRRDWG